MDFPSNGPDNEEEELYRTYTLKELQEQVLGKPYREPKFVVPEEVEEISVKEEPSVVYEEKEDYSFESEYALLDEFMEDEDIAELVELCEVRTVEESREFFVVTDCEAVFFSLQMIFSGTEIIPKLEYNCNVG